MSKKYFIGLFVIWGAVFSCFSQKKEKLDICISSIYLNKDIVGRDPLCLLSCDYQFNERLATGVKIGFSEKIKNKFANEKVIELFLSGFLPLIEDESFFTKSSLGVGYYSNITNNIKDFCFDISFSLNIRITKNLYTGTQATSLILLSNKRTEYLGFVVGINL